MNKSQIFTIYNKAKVAPTVERGRVNRALGILQSRDGGQSKFEQYGTTIKSCGCRDSQFNKEICKHRLALMIKARTYQNGSAYLQADYEEATHG